MKTQPLLLIVDDELAILQTLKEALEDEQYRVKTLSDGNKTLEAIGDLVPDLVLLDIFMPNCNGLDLLSRIKQEYPQQKVIIISGFGSIPIALTAIKSGALDFIEKPLNLDDVLSKIKLVKKNSLLPAKTPSTALVNDFNHLGIIGESTLFLESIHQVRHLAPLNHPLLIYGQHGTGKTLIARYIHHITTANKTPLVLINCSTKIDNFYQQLTTHPQKTLFFKNINDLTQEHQKDLLCFLSSNEYKEQNANGFIKIIASSYQSLFKLALEHSFNHSLLHKLNITPVELIPLNKRRYDIPLLCNYFLAASNELHRKNITLSTNSIRFLRNHNWTGNIAELKAFIEAVVAHAPNQAHVIDNLDLYRFLHEKNTNFVEEQSFLHFNSLEEATETFERNFLTYAMKKNRFNVEAVSDKLKISVDALQGKISKLDICFK